MIANDEEARRLWADEQFFAGDDAYTRLSNLCILCQAACVHLPGGQAVGQGESDLGFALRICDDIRLPVGRIGEFFTDGERITAIAATASATRRLW